MSIQLLKIGRISVVWFTYSPIWNVRVYDTAVFFNMGPIQIKVG